MGVASSDTGVGSNHSTNDQLTYLTRLTICPLQTLFKFAITFFEIPTRIRRVDCRPTRNYSIRGYRAVYRWWQATRTNRRN